MKKIIKIKIKNKYMQCEDCLEYYQIYKMVVLNDKKVVCEKCLKENYNEDDVWCYMEAI